MQDFKESYIKSLRFLLPAQSATFSFLGEEFEFVVKMNDMSEKVFEVYSLFVKKVREKEGKKLENRFSCERKKEKSRRKEERIKGDSENLFYNEMK